MPASTPASAKARRSSLTATVLAGAFLLGACATPEISMPEVRGKSCAYYAERIAELSALVERKKVEGQGEQAAFFAAAVGLSLVVPFAGLATIPAEQEARKDNIQAQSDLWSWRVAFEAKDCK